MNDDDDSGSSKEKVLRITGLSESCSITEEAMDYSGDSEPLEITVPLFNTNSEMCSTRTVRCFQGTKRF
jgi:hypothetical protein